MSKDSQINKDELKERLSKEECNITQNTETEASFSGKYWDENVDTSHDMARTEVVCGRCS